MLMFVSFFLLDGSWGNLGIRSGAHFDLGTLGRAAASVIWAYDGWVAVSMIAGEVMAAEKLMKRIIVAGMAVIVFLYLGANLAYFPPISLPDKGAAKEGGPQALMNKLRSNRGNL